MTGNNINGFNGANGPLNHQQIMEMFAALHQSNVNFPLPALAQAQPSPNNNSNNIDNHQQNDLAIINRNSQPSHLQNSQNNTNQQQIIDQPNLMISPVTTRLRTWDHHQTMPETMQLGTSSANSEEICQNSGNGEKIVIKKNIFVLLLFIVNKIIYLIKMK